MVDLTKNCVNILPCVETSQKKSETYQTKCLKVTCLENDRESAATCIKVKSLDSQTCLRQEGQQEMESGTHHKETSQKESETYQTKCLKVTNDPAHSSLKPTDQTCLLTDASNHGEIDSQTELKKESGTATEGLHCSKLPRNIT